MNLMTERATTGVVIGRFQLHTLHEGHRTLLREIAERHTHMVVLLGVTQAPANAHDPLPWLMRRDAVRDVVPNATILPLHDHPDDAIWSLKVDQALAPFGSCMIYGGKAHCLDHYHGKYPTSDLRNESLIATYSDVHASDSRKSIGLIDSPLFRAGAVWQAVHRYPVSFQAVDIVIDDDHSTNGALLLGRKSHSSLWQFPGGFVDPTDASLEAAAAREKSEEVGVSLETTPPQYLGSCRIEDFRYRASTDKLMTAVMYTRRIFGFAKAGDDLAEVRWVPYDDVASMLQPMHVPINNMFRAYRGFSF